MAPGAPLPTIDLPAQIIENCEFFDGDEAFHNLVIAKEPLGTYKAIVLKTQNRVREVLLSETGASVTEALQNLLVKSAEATQNYISSNGFDFPYIVKKRAKRAARKGEEHDSDSSSSSLTLDDCDSLSDDETVSVSSVGRVKKRRQRKADKSGSSKSKTRQPRARSRSPSSIRTRSRSPCSSSSDSETPYIPPIPSRNPPLYYNNGFHQRMPMRPPIFGIIAFPAAPETMAHRIALAGLRAQVKGCG
ncbi:hypothetical protein N0V88_001647 [Collariella sp. IMI 366227]|nr:hypothetical protein N0V88_001647 [Collariella sp. IMI 366227]